MNYITFKAQFNFSLLWGSKRIFQKDEWKIIIIIAIIYLLLTVPNTGETSMNNTVPATALSKGHVLLPLTYT